MQGKLDDVANPYMKALNRDVRDQYLMGDSIMVAPLFAGEDKRNVVIPSGRWYDFYTGKFVGENTVLPISGDQPDIPMFVREGGIVPMLADGASSDSAVARSLNHAQAGPNHDAGSPALRPRRKRLQLVRRQRRPSITTRQILHVPLRVNGRPPPPPACKERRSPPKATTRPPTA